MPGRKVVSRGFGEPQDETGWGELGMPCTVDCSGHSKGWQWAAQFDIHDVNYSAGNSNSFNEGVRAYAASWRYQNVVSARGRNSG